MSTSYDIDEDLEEKPFDFQLFRRTLTYIRPYKNQLLIVTVFLIVGLVAGLFEPLLIKQAIDHGIMRKDPGVLKQVGLTLLFLYLVGLTAGFIRIKIVNRISQSLIFDLRKELFNHIQGLSFRFFDGRPAGKIMSRITNDVQAISDMVNSGLITFITETVMILGILAIMLIINFKLALMAISVLPFLILMLVRLKPANERAWTKTRKTVANINGNLNETLQGIRVIQAFSRQKYNFKKFTEINQENYRTHITAVAIESIFWPMVDLVGMLGACVVVWYGAGQVAAGKETIGTMIAFVNYLWRFWAPLSAISRVYSQILNAMASSERIFQIIDTPPEIVDPPSAINLERIEGRIEFADVSFGYNPDERMVLHHISFAANPGELTALVGPTGAGKTSIINLLMRFYEPDEGSIKIDGNDIRDIKLECLRSQVGLVLQDSFIFSGTIRENIQYGKLDATPEEIRQVAEMTRVLGFAEKFPNGFETEVEERGAKLSAGQRQLLAFARALISNPQVLILDEATSCVDTETERQIQEALKTLFAGRTSIVIAHRLSTIEHADRIIVIDNGRIVEVGNHRELLAKQGMYHRLYLKQFQEEEAEMVSRLENNLIR
jgi:ATP-binding cassette, subfamily B, multidrug efflux pump